MIAAGLGVDLGAAPHFAHHDHQRRVEQSALVEILDERRIRHVENRQVLVLEHAEVVFVHVVRVAVGAEDFGVHADERHARLDQPPGHEQARPAQVPAVAVAHFVRLVRQVEGLTRLARREHRKRLLGVLAHRLDRSATHSTCGICR